MKKLIESIYVMTTPKRNNEGIALKQIIEASVAASGLDIPVFVNIDRFRNPEDNWYEIMGKPHLMEGGYRITIHDDMTVGRNFVEKANYILNQLPEGHVVCFYCPQNKDYIQAKAQNKHIIQTHYNFWTQCHAFPTHLLNDFIDFTKRSFPESYKSDTRITYYLYKRDNPAFVIRPSLVQHLGMNRSSQGIPGKVGLYKRCTAEHAPELDVYGIDWKHELENAYVTEKKHIVRSKWILE